MKNAELKRNFLFGHPFEKTFYLEVDGLEFKLDSLISRDFLRLTDGQFKAIKFAYIPISSYIDALDRFSEAYSRSSTESISQHIDFKDINILVKADVPCYKNIFDNLLYNSERLILTKAFNDYELSNKRDIVKPYKPIDIKGFIYLAKDPSHNYTKIRWSTNPTVRERTLQADKPLLYISHKFETVKSNDKKLKKLFEERGKRIRGEWFNLSDKDIEEIKNYLTYEK